MRLLRYSCIAASALLLVALGGCRTPEGRIATAANPCCAAAGSPHEACADCLATRGVAAVQHVEEVEDEEEPRGIFTVSLAQPTQLSPAADFDYGDAELVQGVPSEERGDDLSDEDRENSQRAGDELSGLVAVAMAANPQLRRMQAEAAAAWQRVPQLRSLPDPMLSGTVFGEPMMMGGGEMRATLMLSQTLPLLRKLDARAQQASFEALILGQQLQAARWEVSADVQEAWYRLYLLGQLLRINESNQQLVESLLTIATIRVEVGDATPGDVILGTLELSRQEEERLLLQQQVDSRRALLNQLLGRPADSPIALPEAIEEIVGEHSLESLRAVAFQQQPEIVAARLRTEATNWGIRLAELERVPDPTVSFEQMFMKMDPGVDRPNPWQVGLGVNLPLWHPKYQAMRREATEQHFAAHSGVEEAVRATESRLLDLLAQVQAAHATTELYRETILPQARQAVEVDQRAYGQGAVQFERVIANARNLLTAESAYHRAVVDRAVAVARLEQAAGGRLPRAIEAFDPPASFEPIPLRE